MRIAFIGIGLMGLPMAKRLCEAGLQPHVWNRTRAKAEPLAALGAKVHDTLAQAVRDADIVVTMLEDGKVVESVLFADGLAQRSNAAACSSICRPSSRRKHAATGSGWPSWAWAIWMPRYPAEPWARKRAIWPSWPAAATRTLNAAAPC